MPERANALMAAEIMDLHGKKVIVGELRSLAWGIY